MSQISSINLKKSIAINIAHNDRTLPPSYLIDDEKGAECNRTAESARELKDQIIKEAMRIYTQRTGQRFQAKTYEWSAVVNIKPESTMQDLENLAKHFSDKYGFQCYQIAIHRDEGHINEQGEKAINHHAHLEFITLDKNTGVNCFKMRDFPKRKMREIQTEVAEILRMQRGQDKRESGRQRVGPRKDAQMKEQEKTKTKELMQELQAQILSNKQLKELLGAERKAFIAENQRLKEQQQQALYNAEDHKKLRELKKYAQALENTLLKQEKELRAQSNIIKEQEKTIQNLKSEIAHNHSKTGNQLI